jgi:hypothetical protein
VFSVPVQQCKTATAANLVRLGSSTAVLKMLTVFHRIKKFPASYGASVLVIVFSRARHFPLTLAKLFQSVNSLPVSLMPIVTTSHLRLDFPSGLFPSDCPPTPSIPVPPPLPLLYPITLAPTDNSRHTIPAPVSCRSHLTARRNVSMNYL